MLSAPNSPLLPSTLPNPGFVGCKYTQGIRDGVSNTIFFGEKYGLCQTQGNAWGDSLGSGFTPAFATTAGPPWPLFQLQPTAATCNPASQSQTPHNAGMVVCMGDGSARTISSGVSAATWYAAITPNGNDQLGADW
jgi:hypothetical protein